MSIVYNTTVINNRLQQVVNAIDGGAGSGQIRIGTTGMAGILATITLNKPCGTISSGILTFSVPVSDISASAGGTPAAAQILDSAGTLIASGITVGISGTDIVLSQSTIAIGDIVTLTSGTITGN